MAIKGYVDVNIFYHMVQLVAVQGCMITPEKSMG